ncbi:yop-1, partial [Symbiodinium pilosum]
SREKACHLLGEVVLCTQTCTISTTLGDACDLLIASGNTGTLVMDQGEVVGVITENDILAALMDGIDRDIPLDLWLRGGKARLPGCMVNALTLTPAMSLQKAADRMAGQAEMDSGYACHHLLVSNGSKPHLVSDLDVARSFITNLPKRSRDSAMSLQVKQAMKARENVATCRLSDKLIDAYRIMFESRQNCVLVVEGLGDVDGENVLNPEDQGSHIHGVITVTDALRTFSECQSGDNTTVKGFLNGLTAAEHFTAPGRSIFDTWSLLEAAERMSELGIHHLVVLRERRADEKEIVGVLSALDIVCALSSASWIPGTDGG